MGYLGSLDHGVLVEIKEALDSLDSVGDEKSYRTIYVSLPIMIDLCEKITRSAELNEGEIFDETINPFELKRRLYKLKDRNQYNNK